MKIDLINFCFIFLLLAFISNLFFIILKNKNIFLVFFRLFLSLNIIVIGIVIIKRWMDIDYVPLTNLFETFILMIFFVSVIYFFITFIIKSGWLNFSVLALIILMFAYMTRFLDSSVKPLMPALKSKWLTIHVFSYMLSYSLIALSFIISVIVIINFITRSGEFDTAEKKSFILSDYNYTMISLSFPMLNIGLFTGSIWAKQAWGDYWSWDPKETWALICWVYYLNYFHIRIWLKRLLKNNFVKYIPVCESIFLIFGFFLILITYFGLKSQASLHSY
ncbi:cytochrome c biogenesis protein CcsA [Candidatus Dependentiae bacterium]|nr:cytochrome c biogenesis protein CcsA [Candidatus Dependentiae bacterium]